MEDICENYKKRCKTLVVHEGRYRTLLTNKYINRKQWAPKDEKILFSVIPGTVLKVFCNAGNQVKKGEKALILEAMKMENAVTYPYSGTIKKVQVKVGDKIPKNFAMIEYETIITE